MRYYNVRTFSEIIPIDETELPRALYAQISGKVVILKNGSISGNSIFSITPNYHKAMGWNSEYKLTPDDYSEINRRCKDYQGKIGDVKMIITSAMKDGTIQQFLENGDKLLLES